MKKTRPTSRKQTVGQTITAGKRPKRKNHLISGFIVMIALVMLFFFAYQKYQRISNSYHHYLYQTDWQIKNEHVIEQAQPTVILTVGMAFPDAGRIQPEEAIAWQLTAIHPQTKKTVQFSLSPDLIVGGKRLSDYNPRKEMTQIQMQLQKMIQYPIQYATLINLSQGRPLYEKLKGLTVVPNESLQLEDKTITTGKATLLSTRQVLQYILHDSNDTKEKASQRQLEVINSLKKELFDWQNLLQLQNYFEAADTVVNTSIPWQEYLRLIRPSWQKALEQATTIDISQSNQAAIAEELAALSKQE
ncbi:hypothetical protein IU402_04995 [Aerococcaceae bacterium zg-BR9]|uniref:hypothetical protein n=1 Tax=Aerococcaceae bacterium zg-1292 TaxID=2774330 RepID=UPI0040632051|nr:hypothetical protein [Aerococcaceae bacterium zg-BR9]